MMMKTHMTHLMEDPSSQRNACKCPRFSDTVRGGLRDCWEKSSGLVGKPTLGRWWEPHALTLQYHSFG